MVKIQKSMLQLKNNTTKSVHPTKKRAARMQRV